jgi:hypothetical protein
MRLNVGAHKRALSDGPRREMSVRHVVYDKHQAGLGMRLNVVARNRAFSDGARRNEFTTWFVTKNIILTECERSRLFIPLPVPDPRIQSILLLANDLAVHTIFVFIVASVLF